MNFDLHGRVALVTGASRGLGDAIAKTLAAQGARVVVNYAQAHDQAGEVVRAIRGQGGEALAVQAHVLDAAQVARLVREVEAHYGPVEILVNNATGPQPDKPLEDYTWRDFQDQLDFFLKAPLLLMQATLPPMRRARWGRVIHIGSEVAELGNANFSSYASAKAAMTGLTRSWASELGGDGVTVNLVAPGWIPVERHTDLSGMDAYLAGVALKRHGVPEDVGFAVAFLASDEANFITGQRLAVNGGKTY